MHALIAPGQLTKRSYGEDILTEQISYDIQGRTTSRESPLFRIGLRYEKPLKATPRYAGDIAEWTCSYRTEPEQTYTFNYDGAGRFTGGNHYENGVLVNKYAEQGITYDKNGNILSLKRFNNGALVDNLTYTYSGNRLSSLTEAATPATGDIYLRQNAATATYDYDGYGNLIKDSRKNLNFEYNILNLIHSVKQGTGLQAEYEYTYTGSKLRVTASDGKGAANCRYPRFPRLRGPHVRRSAGKVVQCRPALRKILQLKSVRVLRKQSDTAYRPRRKRLVFE